MVSGAVWRTGRANISSFNNTHKAARLANLDPVTVDHGYDHGMSEFDLNVGLYRRDSWYRYLIRNERVLEN